MKAQRTPLCAEPRKAWATTRPSSAWRFQSQGKCTCGRTSTAPGSPASSTGSTRASSGTSTTRLTTISTTPRPRSSRATSLTSSTPTWSTSAPPLSTSWSRVPTTRTLGFYGSTRARRMRTSPLRSWTGSGSTPTDMASAVSSPMASFSCGSTSRGIVTGDRVFTCLDQILRDWIPQIYIAFFWFFNLFCVLRFTPTISCLKRFIFSVVCWLHIKVFF